MWRWLRKDRNQHHDLDRGSAADELRIRDRYWELR
jgi:hypothetical protein